MNGQKTGEPNKTYASQFAYASHGAITSMTLGNSLAESMTFNNRLQPTFIKLGTSSNPTSVLQLGYEYTATCQTGNNGNVLRQTITAPGLSLTQDYCYDALNRLSSATETGAWTQTYDYDRYGNRAVRNTSYMPQPQLTPQSAFAGDLSAFSASSNRVVLSGFAYDSAGNLSGDPTTAANGMVYDAENRQISYTKAGATTTYFYDGDGRRVKKVVGSVTTIFVYNVLGQLIAEYTSDPVPPAAGGGGTSYLTSDHLGSTRVVTDVSGNVKARHDYLPFGEEIPSTVGSRISVVGYGGADSTRQKFTQKERDSESGLDYFGARYYSSAQGRFTSPDPLERLMLDEKKQALFFTNPQRWNKYVYVLNNPLRNVDPDGLAEIPVWAGLSKELQDDLAKRFGGAKNVQDVWNNQFDNTKRQQVLNLRAALIDQGVWGNVTSIAFLQVNTERNTFSENRVTATVDNKNGWELAITTNKDITSTLRANGFESESPAWHHHEGRWTLLQKGDDIVLHLIGLHPPADQFIEGHFDSGGGSFFNSKHRSDWWNNTGPTPDQITSALGKTSAGQYLKGISPEVNKLLVPAQKK